MSTDAVWALIIGLFWLGFLVVVLVAILAFRSHKNLRALGETLEASLADLESAINERITRINEMYGLLMDQTPWRSSSATPCSGRSTDSILAAHRQASALLASMEEVVALRFPDLNVHSEFVQVGKRIEQSEAIVHQKIQAYNSAVRIYNGARAAIPTVLYANLMRYPRADRFELDLTAAVSERFEEEDTEMLRNLAAGARIQIAGARDLAARYFYMFPGGVPKGPATAQDLRILMAQGVLQSSAMVAEVGSQEWKPIESLTNEWEEEAAN